MGNIPKKQKVILCFSQAVTTPIYDAIVEEYSEMNVDIFCVYFGAETIPLQSFANSLSLQTTLLPVKSRFEALGSFVKFIFLCWKISPQAVISFGQTATLLGLSGTLVASRAKRAYFRQHTSSNKVGLFSKGHIYDVLSNFLAQKIIVSNKNTESYLIREEKIKAGKITICEFGFHITAFTEDSSDRIYGLKNKYKIPENSFIIGIVSRVTPIKGLQYSFTAFSDFLEKYPTSVLLLANAMDADPRIIDSMASEIPTSNLRILERETDMVALYGCMDVLIHVPIASEIESYGLVYVEAFLSGLPTIVTLSGIAHEIAENEKNCLVVQYKDAEGIYKALLRLKESETLRLSLGESAFHSVSHLSMEKMRLKFRDFLLFLLAS